MKYVPEKIGYDQHKRFICVDLTMVNFLLGQQSGLTKYPCFLCMWDSKGPCSALHEDGQAFAGRIGVLQRKESHQRTSGGQRQNTLSTAAHRARLNQAVHQGSGQEW